MFLALSWLVKCAGSNYKPYSKYIFSGDGNQNWQLDFYFSNWHFANNDTYRRLCSGYRRRRSKKNCLGAQNPSLFNYRIYYYSRHSRYSCAFKNYSRDVNFCGKPPCLFKKRFYNKIKEKVDIKTNRFKK